GMVQESRSSRQRRAASLTAPTLTLPRWRAFTLRDRGHGVGGGGRGGAGHGGLPPRPGRRASRSPAGADPPGHRHPLPPAVDRGPPLGARLLLLLRLPPLPLGRPLGVGIRPAQAEAPSIPSWARSTRVTSSTGATHQNDRIVASQSASRAAASAEPVYSRCRS